LRRRWLTGRSSISRCSLIAKSILKDSQFGWMRNFTRGILWFICTSMRWHVGRCHSGHSTAIHTTRIGWLLERMSVGIISIFFIRRNIGFNLHPRITGRRRRRSKVVLSWSLGLNMRTNNISPQYIARSNQHCTSSNTNNDNDNDRLCIGSTRRILVMKWFQEKRQSWT